MKTKGDLKCFNVRSVQLAVDISGFNQAWIKNIWEKPTSALNIYRIFSPDIVL